MDPNPNPNHDLHLQPLHPNHNPTVGGRGGCGCERVRFVDSEDESEEESESEGMSESEVDNGSEGENESEGKNESVKKFGVGDPVHCHWHQDGSDNQWYDCVVLQVHIDNESRTTHVRCDDGDERESMSWDWMVLLQYDLGFRVRV